MKEEILLIKKRVKKLRKKQVKPFGYDGHKMKLNSPISQNNLEALEQKYQVVFPEDYRLFLLNVANGGAGPGYGLEDIESGISYQRVFYPQDILSRAFKHQEEYNYYNDPELDELEKLLDDGHISEADFDLQLEYLTAGTLVLCHEGCGHLYRLVVTGPTRGQVWIDSDVSDQGYSNLKISFYQWYDRWLEDIENTCKRKRFFR